MINEVKESTLHVNLSEILERASRGEQIAITRDGAPIAVLGPPMDDVPNPSLIKQRQDAFAQMRKVAKGKSLGGISIRELVEEGRR